MQEKLKCPICSGRAEFRLKIENRHIYGCGDCQTQFVNPMLEYHGEYVANDPENPYYGWLVFNRQSRIIREIIPQGRILDYGCGGGQFLSHMKGWRKYGVEKSNRARTIASGKGIQTYMVHYGGLVPTDYFDVITMFATIEHLRSPRAVIRQLGKSLKNHGLFVIMTGDITSKRAIEKGDKWHMYISPEHFYFFSAKALDMMMADLGFEKIRSLHTDGGMFKVPYLDKLPLLNRLPLFDHYYGYYRKVAK